MYPAVRYQGCEHVIYGSPKPFGPPSCSGSLPFDGCSGHSRPRELPGKVTVHSACSYVLFFEDRPAHMSVCQGLRALAATMQDVYVGVRDPYLPREDHMDHMDRICPILAHFFASNWKWPQSWLIALFLLCGPSYIAPYISPPNS